MKRVLVLSFILLLPLGCGSSPIDETRAVFALPPNITIEFIGGPVCCDPNKPLPQELGTLRISHIGEEGSEAVDVELGEFEGGGVLWETEGQYALPISRTATLVPGDVFLTKIIASDCEWETVFSDLRFKMALGERYRQRVALNNTCSELGGLLAILPVLDERAQANQLLIDSVIRGIISVAVPWSDQRVAAQVPGELWTEVFAYGAAVRELLFSDLARAFEDAAPDPDKPRPRTSHGAEFPCGVGPHGYTVCSVLEQPRVEGNYILAYLAVLEPIPLAGSRYTTFGFVFDADGNTTNNYTPHPSFPDDYFKDSDRWYTLEYVPGLDWVLVCRTAMGDVVQEVPTGARAIIKDNNILLVVPASEFSVPDPRYRVTSFTHTGDFGANPPHDWSGDQHPRVSEGLGPFVRED